MPNPDTDFQNRISMQPEMGPLTANEEPTEEEAMAMQDISAEVIKVIHGDNNSAVLGVMSNTPELYQGVAQAAFQILLSSKQKYESGGQKVPPAALFGEGAAIHTAVDELFQLAQAAGLPGSEEQDQYSAAIMDVMRQAGEHIEKSGDDTSIAEAQELLIDIEATGPNAGVPDYTEEDASNVESTVRRSLDKQNQSLNPEYVDEGPPPEEQEQMMPQQAPIQGGGILNG